MSYEYPHFIEAQLIAGKTCTLKETIAPDGYTIANSIDFTVNEDGTVNIVVMYDEPIPRYSRYDTTSRLPGILMIAAGLVMVLIAGMGRKKKTILHRKKLKESWHPLCHESNALPIFHLFDPAHSCFVNRQIELGAEFNR